MHDCSHYIWIQQSSTATEDDITLIVTIMNPSPVIKTDSLVFHRWHTTCATALSKAEVMVMLESSRS